MKRDLGTLGHVAVAEVHGSDLTIVNAARASYARTASTFGEPERRLLAYLARHGHGSPFRHASIAFDIEAPMMVARQWFKYRIGSAHTPDVAELDAIDLPIVARTEDGQGDDGDGDLLHARNEASRRYVRDEPTFYVPGEWRRAPVTGKQGSGDPIDGAESDTWSRLLGWHVAIGTRSYRRAIEAGLAPEQARLFLPAYALRTSWRWTASVAAVAHFVRERTHAGAQWEMRQFANAVRELATEAFPVAIPLLLATDSADAVR